MDTKQFEQAKEIPYYDEFMETVLDFDNLTMEDYQNFMPKVLPIILQQKDKDAFLIFENTIDKLREEWTASETLPFHGPWHHGIVPAVIITALRNNGYDFTDKDIKEAFSRGLKIPAGGCGFCGTCGGGSGLGIAVSLVKRANPFHDKARSAAFEAAQEANKRIGKLGGPRCCRLSAYTAIDQALKILNNMDYHLTRSKVIGRCDVWELNNDCHMERCPYFPRDK
ncbi:MAG: DUF5714 domain-containing protein [Promethearchaeati archaeon]